MSDYQQVFKSKSTIELLYIVDSQSDYSNEAFEAATSELETRTDVDEWQLEMKRQKEEAEDKKDKTVSLEDAIKVKFLGLFQMLSPINKGAPDAPRRITWLAVFFAGIFIFKLLSEFEFMWYQFIEGIAHINLGYFLEATVLLTIPIGAYLLYRLKSTGWGLLYSYSLFTSTGLFISAALNWNRESTGIEILDLMLNETSSLEYILGGFFYVALALTLLSKPIRNVFLISTTKLLIWTGIGFVLLPLLVYFT